LKPYPRLLSPRKLAALEHPIQRRKYNRKPPYLGPADGVAAPPDAIGFLLDQARIRSPIAKIPAQFFDNETVNGLIAMKRNGLLENVWGDAGKLRVMYAGAESSVGISWLEAARLVEVWERSRIFPNGNVP
jgi:hypothetical protein